VLALRKQNIVVSFTSYFAYKIDQVVSLRPVETSIFIIAGHTEGSTKYLLLLKIWLSAATVLQRLLCHLSIYVTANHIFWVRFADAN